MKLLVNNINLRNALKLLSSVISPSALLPALECVKFTVTEDTLYLEGSDVETTIKTWVSCEANCKFSFMMDFTEIMDFTKTVNAGALTISLRVEEAKEGTKYHLEIKSELGVSKRMAQSADLFPKLPEIDVLSSIDLDANGILKLKTSIDFASRDPKLVTLYGICFDFKNDGLIIAATDANFLYKTDIFPSETSKKKKVMLPIKAAKCVSSFMPTAKASVSDNFMLFANDYVEIYTRLIDQTYPDYNSIIPTYDHSFTVDKAELISAVKYALLSASKESNACNFSLNLNHMTISSDDVSYSKEGTCEPINVSNKTCPDFSFTFNGVYLLSTISHLDADITFHTDGAKDRAFILDSEAVKDTTLLMPILHK